MNKPSTKNEPSREIERHYELTDPDVRLMLQVRNDDAGAFEELMRRYQTRLIAVLEHLLPGQDLAEDMAQEVFLRIYRARKTYSPNAKFSTWMFTIANNVASNTIRKLSRRKEVHVQGTPSGSVPTFPLENMVKDASGLMPARVLARSEQAEVVAAAIQSLNERQRMALLLNKFEHMNYADIAATMDLTPQAVKSLLSRARCKLKDILLPYIESGQSLDGIGQAEQQGMSSSHTGGAKQSADSAASSTADSSPSLADHPTSTQTGGKSNL